MNVATQQKSLFQDEELHMTRPERVMGMTYKIRWPGSEHAIYITINNVEEGGCVRPFEIFSRL